MGVFFRSKPQVEQRAAFTDLPRHVQDAIIGYTNSSYSEINLSRAENSLQSVAVRSAVDLIASTTSELPFDVFSGRGPDRVEIPMSRHSWLEDPDGSDQGLEDWIYQAMVSWLLRGNVYGDILDVSASGMLRQVALWHPDDVRPRVEQGMVKWFAGGQEVPDRRMLHRRVNPVPGYVLGLSPIAYHMPTIGLQLATTRFGLQWFTDGAHPSGVLSNSESSINPEQASEVKQRFMAALRGTRDPVVLGRGWRWDQLQINPEESQFLETQGFSAAECARMFGPGVSEILGYGTEGSTLTYSNLQDRDIHVLKYALNKWLRRMERMLSAFLPRPQYVRFNRDALLETNTVQRYQAYQIALQNGFRTVNEVRDKEDWRPVPWGDSPVGGATASGSSEADQARSVAELIQKIYLGVGKVITDEEARAIANRGGAGIQPGPLPQTEQ